MVFPFAFPIDKYKIYQIPLQGSFYLDEQCDSINSWLRLRNAWKQELWERVRGCIKPHLLLSAGNFERE